VHISLPRTESKSSAYFILLLKCSKVNSSVNGLYFIINKQLKKAIGKFMKNKKEKEDIRESLVKKKKE